MIFKLSVSQWYGELIRPTNPAEAVEALACPRFVLSINIKNIKNFKICKISNQLLLRNLFSCYLRTLKIKMSPFPSNYVPPMHLPQLSQVCVKCNINLNQNTLVSIRYTNEKALKGAEMCFRIDSSHATKR